MIDDDMSGDTPGAEDTTGQDFSVFVLFTDTLITDISEILAALRSDHGDLAWPDPIYPGDQGEFRTGMVSMAKWLGEDRINLLSVPGNCSVDFDYQRAYLFDGAEDAVRGHRTYLSVTVSPRSGARADRIEAATRATCIAAVFAALPNCAAVYMRNSGVLISPARCLRAAEKARGGGIPLNAWVGFPHARFAPDADGPAAVTAYSEGMAFFIGQEVSLPLARLSGPDSVRLVRSAAYLLLVQGARFNDCDTLGPAEDPARARLRFQPANGPRDADTWVMFDRSCGLDQQQLFGDARAVVALADTVAPQPAEPQRFLRRLLRGGPAFQ